MRESNFVRYVFIFLFLIFFSLSVYPDSEIDVGAGFANLTISVSSSGSPVEGAEVVLLNGSYGPSQNTPYEFDSQTFSLETDSFGNVTFFNLSIEDNYSVSVMRNGYYVNISDPINVSDGINPLNESALILLFLGEEEPFIEVVSSYPDNNSVLQGSSFEITFDLDDSLVPDDINVSLFISKDGSGFAYNASENYSAGLSLMFSLPFISDDGNYSWYLNATNYLGLSNITAPKQFYVDTIDPTYSNVFLIPGNSQNASQYINLSANIDSTGSYLEYVRFYVDGVLVREEDTTDFGIIHDAVFDWGYMIPNSSAGQEISFRYCFMDAGYQTDEVCTSYLYANITDNIPPEILGFGPNGAFMLPEDVFDFWVWAIDSSSDILNVNVSLFNGTDYVLNESTSSHTLNNYTFSFIPDLPDFNYTINISATDDFNNTIRGETWLVIDTIAPNVSFVSVSNIYAKEGDVLQVSAEIYDNYNVLLDDFEVFAQFDYQGSSPAQMVYTSGNTWEANVTVTSSEDITSVLNISAIDLAGNMGWNDSVSVSIKNTPPSIIVNSPSMGYIYNATLPSESTLNATINFSISDLPNATYFTYANNNYVLPTYLEQEFNLSLIYPGKHVVYFYANDSAGNLGSNSTTFYANFLFNTTTWLDDLLANNPDLDFAEFINFTDGNPTSFPDEMVNITDGTLIMLRYNFTDGRDANFTFDLFETELTYNLSLETDNIDFVDDFAFYAGTEVIDFVRIGNSDKLSEISGFIELSYNSSDFEDIFVCYDNYFECEEITEIDTSDIYYFSDFNGTTVVLNSISFTNNYTSFILANDTIPPRVEFISPENQTTFTSSDNIIQFMINEPAFCSYVIDLGVDEIASSNVGSGILSAYTVHNINLPNLQNEDYVLRLTCEDESLNSDSFEFHYSLNDTTPVQILTLLPGSGSSFPIGTTSVSLTAVSSKESVCRHRILGSTSDGTLMASSDGITHTGTFSVGSGLNFELEVICEAYDDTIDSRTTSFSITAQTEDALGGQEGPAESEDSIHVSDVFAYSFISANEEIVLTLSRSDYPASSIRFSSEENIENITFTVEGFTNQNYFNLNAPGLNNVYRYLQIRNNRNIDISEFSQFRIVFSVSSSFISSNDLVPEDILIGRFNQNTNDWEVIERTFIGQEGNRYQFDVIAEPSSLFAVSYERSGATGEVLVDDGVGSVVVQNGDSDDSGEVHEVVATESLSFEDIPSFLGYAAILVTISIIAYANRGIVTKMAVKKEIRNKKKAMKSKKKQDKGDLRSIETKNYTKGMYGQLSKKLKEISIPSKEVDVPTEAVLKDYLSAVFKNIWINGYNDDKLRKSFVSAGWPQDKIYTAYQYIKADASDEKYASVDSDVESLLEHLRMAINEKYGFNQQDLLTTLKSNGWPSYMLKSTLKDMRDSLVLPIDYNADNMGEELKNEDNNTELREYIEKARVHGMSKEEIHNSLLNAGWPSEVVMSSLSNEFIK